MYNRVSWILILVPGPSPGRGRSSREPASQRSGLASSPVAQRAKPGGGIIIGPSMTASTRQSSLRQRTSTCEPAGPPNAPESGHSPPL